MTLVMGILNVTPDSFSDGGEYLDPKKAIARGLEMIEEGATIIDVGGESTKPGADRVSLDEELTRVIPVIHTLAKTGAMVSVDTMRAEVAAMAVASGARIINDVSGGLSDPAMFATVKKLGVPYILMHWRAHSKTMQDHATYKDVVREVKEELEARIEAAIEAGINPEQIIIDPGLGFSKLPEHNWELLRNIDRIALLGYPILIGASRKRFLGELTGSTNPDDREAASIAVTAMVAKQNVWGVRTHSVKPHRDAIATVNSFLKSKVEA